MDESRPHYGRNTHVLPGMTEKQAASARMLDAPTLVVVLLVIPALLLHFSEAGGWAGTLSSVLNWLIYGWFAFEFAVMLYLAPSDREYFKNNKLDLLVLLTTIPILPDVWQAFFVLRLLRLIDVLPVLLGRFGSITLLPYAITLAFIGVFGGGLAFAEFEDVSIFDGIYWANTTINTVGYGDVTATTTLGKILAMVVQWTGNVILALLIGGVAATAQRMLLSTAGSERETNEILGQVEEVSEDVEDIEEDVEDIEEDVDKLLRNSEDLSEMDRVILQELKSIKQRLDEASPKG